MAQKQTDGIVIQKRNYREIDLIATVFSREFGKISGIAFGARKSMKRFANCMDLFSYSRFFFTPRSGFDLVRMDSCELIRGMENVSKDLNGFAHASYIAELTSSLTAEEDRNVEIFELLSACLGLIDEHSSPEDITRIFEIRFLTLLGYKLVLDRCMACKKDVIKGSIAYFDSAEGGIRCDSCAVDRSLPLHDGTLKGLLFAQSEPLATACRIRLGKRAGEEAEKILETLFVHLMQKRPKSLDSIRQAKEHER